jgi:protein TonB
MAETAGVRLAGLAVIALLHAAAVWGLWPHRRIPPPQEAETLAVRLIPPPAAEEKEKPKPPPVRKAVARPGPRPVVAETPVGVAADEPVPLLLPQQAPAIVEPPAPALPPVRRTPADPFTFDGELAVACKDRPPPDYPRLSRRLGEEGVVVLRIELDEEGNVTAAQVSASSGFTRLDQAALAAVRTWRCTPARREGQSVHAVAAQTFKFILHGH